MREKFDEEGLYNPPPGVVGGPGGTQSFGQLSPSEQKKVIRDWKIQMQKWWKKDWDKYEKAFQEKQVVVAKGYHDEDSMDMSLDPERMRQIEDDGDLDSWNRRNPDRINDDDNRPMFTRDYNPAGHKYDRHIAEAWKKREAERAKRGHVPSSAKHSWPWVC